MRINRITIISLIIIALWYSRADKQFKSILDSPEKFDGKEVEITGILHYQFEDVALYFTSGSDKDNAIWIDLAHSTLIHYHNGERIKLTGIYSKEDKGHLNQYAGTLIDLKDHQKK